jgi:hypothetical protein
MRFTKKQKKGFYEKTGAFASAKLKYLRSTGELLYQEVGEICDLSANRISEIVNHGELNQKKLASLLQGEIVTIAELQDKVDYTKEEREFLVKSFGIFERKDLIAQMSVAEELGIDLDQLVREAIAKKREAERLAQMPPSKISGKKQLKGGGTGNP